MAKLHNLHKFVILIISLSMVVQARADCIDSAARYHHVFPQLVRAIAMQESGMHADRVGPTNANGTYDIGLMQINSSWLPTLAKSGITRSDLLNGCVNAYVGSWILEKSVAQLGLNWEAVGAYNARSKVKREQYANAVYRQLLKVVANGNDVGAIRE